MKFGAAIICLNEWRFINAVAGQLFKVCDRVVLLRNNRSLSGAPVILTSVPKDLNPKIEICNLSVGGIAKDDLKIRERTVEADLRNTGMEILSDCDHIFTIDSDEIIPDWALIRLRDTAARGHRAVACHFRTYWKSPHYEIQPPDRIPAVVILQRGTRFQYMRVLEGDPHVLNEQLVYHLSYVRSDDEVMEKIRLYAHAHQISHRRWFDNVWKVWDSCKTLQNLHPVRPTSFGEALQVDSSELLRILAEHSTSFEGLGGAV